MKLTKETEKLTDLKTLKGTKVFPNVKDANVPETIQRKLTAGKNITIDNNVISATDQQPDLSGYQKKLTAGTGIEITSSNVINNTQPSPDLSGYQKKLTAGKNITIDNNVISATDQQPDLSNYTKTYTIEIVVDASDPENPYKIKKPVPYDEKADYNLDLTSIQANAIYRNNHIIKIDGKLYLGFDDINMADNLTKNADVEFEGKKYISAAISTGLSYGEITVENNNITSFNILEYITSGESMTENFITPNNAKDVLNYQEKLKAGANITIDAGNTIEADQSQFLNVSSFDAKTYSGDIILSKVNFLSIDNSSFVTPNTILPALGAVYSGIDTTELLGNRKFCFYYAIAYNDNNKFNYARFYLADINGKQLVEENTELHYWLTSYTHTIRIKSGTENLDVILTADTDDSAEIMTLPALCSVLSGKTLACHGHITGATKTPILIKIQNDSFIVYYQNNQDDTGAQESATFTVSDTPEITDRVRSHKVQVMEG